MRIEVRVIAASVTLLLATLTSVRASAAKTPEDVARCRASYEASQVLRRDEHLDAARTQLLICESTCPDALVADCTKWLHEVEALTPTVRIDARDANGRRVPDVRLTVDGAPARPREDGAIAIEPGVRVFRVEAAGFEPVERRVEVHAGEREHPISVALVALVAARAKTQPAPSVTPARPSEPPSRAPSYVLGGIGGAALVAAGILAIVGHVDRSSLASSCAPTCDPSRVDAIRTLWWTAAGIGAAGTVAVGLAIALWPRGQSASSAATPTLTLGARSVALGWDLP